MSPRIGYISTYDKAKGTASVYYPDRTGETTNQIPVFTPFGAIGTMRKGDMVLVEYLDNGSAVILGTFAGNGAPECGITTLGGSLTLKDASGSITVAELLAIKSAHEGGV